MLNKPPQLAVLLWSLHLVCSQQVPSPVDRLSDIHPASQTWSGNLPEHMAKKRGGIVSLTVIPTEQYGDRINICISEQSSLCAARIELAKGTFILDCGNKINVTGFES